MRLRWLRAYTIVQCLLKIFKLKRAEFELWTASKGEENKSPPISAFTYATFQRFIAFDRPKGVQIISNIHFQYGCFIRLEMIDRIASTHRMDERPTEGRMTRQNARSWLSMMVLSVFFRSFKTLSTRNKHWRSLRRVHQTYRNWASACMVTKSHWWMSFFFRSSRAR